MTWRQRSLYAGGGLVAALAIALPIRLLASGTVPPSRIDRADAQQLRADQLEVQMAEMATAPARARIKAIGARYALGPGDRIDIDGCDATSCAIVRQTPPASSAAAAVPDAGARK